MGHSPRWVLGVAASHNGGACLLRDDEIVVSVQEERLNRYKRATLVGGRESLAIQYCLAHAGIRPRDLSAVVYSSPHDAAEQHLAQDPVLNLAGAGVPVHWVPHHLAHAFGVFATSGFPDAAVLVVDGRGSPWGDVGEAERRVAIGAPSDATAAEHAESISLYDASGVEIVPIEKHFGDWTGFDDLSTYRTDRELAFREARLVSLGALFARASVQIFGDASEAGKVMGLAPYGRPTIPASEFLRIEGGRFVYSDVAWARFDHDERWPAHAEAYQDLAASLQVALEGALLHLVARLRATSRSTRLCYAGGVALNSIANERIVREGGFDDVYIMPAAEDSGTAIGAAYWGLWRLDPRNTRRRLAKDSVGRPYSLSEIDRAIEETPAVSLVTATSTIEKAVDVLCEGKIVGWFEGGSELGPRALGQRSILCDPRGPEMKDYLNHKVKHREGFRPFAPIVPLEDARAWFDLPDGVPHESPFMLRICPFREDKRALVPAVVHVDGTGRLQTLTAETNGRLYELVKAFGRRTGVPILLNTSFNVAGEPIVEQPSDALWCLLYTGLDYLVLEDRIVTKAAAYRSILDLYPRRAPLVSIGFDTFGSPDQAFSRRLASSAELPGRVPIPVMATTEGLYIARLREAEGTIVKLRVETPWGIVTQVVTLEILGVLEEARGDVDGKTLFEKVAARSLLGDPTPEGFVRLLGTLRRASLLTFHDGPHGTAAAPQG